MKIAVVITGFLRENQNPERAFAQFWNNPDVDIFPTCWDLRSTKAPGGKSKDIFQHVDEQTLLGRYPTAKNFQILNKIDYENNRPYTPRIMDRDNDIFKISPRAKTHFEVGYAQRITDMFYLNDRAMDIVPAENYDLIVKLRHDMYIQQPLPIELNDILNIDDHQQVLDPYNSIEYSSPNATVNLSHEYMRPYALSYQIAWGKPEIMKTYMELYKHIQEMYEVHNVDISAYEHVMAYYIMMKNIPHHVHKIEKTYHFIR